MLALVTIVNFIITNIEELYGNTGREIRESGRSLLNLAFSPIPWPCVSLQFLLLVVWQSWPSFRQDISASVQYRLESLLVSSRQRHQRQKGGGGMDSSGTRSVRIKNFRTFGISTATVDEFMHFFFRSRASHCLCKKE